MSVKSPYLPVRPVKHKFVPRPTTAQPETPLSLLPLTVILFKGIVTGLPKQIGSLGLRVGIAFIVNTVLGSIATYKLSGFLASLVGLLVFLTATYNSIIPKALFWVLVMTIGTKLVYRVRAEGIGKVKSDLLGFLPAVQKAWNYLGNLAIVLMGVGGGMGFVLANFLSRNNRINKMLVCYVAAFSIVDALSRGTHLFLFSQAAANDAFKMLKRPSLNVTNHTYIIALSLAGGLVGNTVFAIIALDNGGYLLGSLLVIGAIVYCMTQNKHKQKSVQG